MEARNEETRALAEVVSLVSSEDRPLFLILLAAFSLRPALTARDCHVTMRHAHAFVFRASFAVIHPRLAILQEIVSES